MQRNASDADQAPLELLRTGRYTAACGLGRGCGGVWPCWVRQVSGTTRGALLPIPITERLAYELQLLMHIVSKWLAPGGQSQPVVWLDTGGTATHPAVGIAATDRPARSGGGLDIVRLTIMLEEAARAGAAEAHPDAVRECLGRLQIYQCGSLLQLLAAVRMLAESSLLSGEPVAPLPLFLSRKPRC